MNFSLRGDRILLDHELTVDHGAHVTSSVLDLQLVIQGTIDVRGVRGCDIDSTDSARGCDQRRRLRDERCGSLLLRKRPGDGRAGKILRVAVVVVHREGDSQRIATEVRLRGEVLLRCHQHSSTTPVISRSTSKTPVIDSARFARPNIDAARFVAPVIDAARFVAPVIAASTLNTPVMQICLKIASPAVIERPNATAPCINRSTPPCDPSELPSEPITPAPPSQSSCRLRGMRTRCP